jgi:hypothetical protein
LISTLHFVDFNAHVRWIQVGVRPVFAFQLGPEPFRLLRHAVLQIILPDGQILYFDGSVEQFGWYSDTWLVEQDYFLQHHIDEFSYWVNVGEDFEQRKKDVGALIELYQGYLGRAHDGMKDDERHKVDT